VHPDAEFGAEVSARLVDLADVVVHNVSPAHLLLRGEGVEHHRVACSDGELHVQLVLAHELHKIPVADDAVGHGDDALGGSTL
jgi:hypothetical protein